MILSDELKARGLTKGKLAELLGVNRKTVQRMGEDVSDEVLRVINDFVPEIGFREKEPDEFTYDEVTALIKRRGGLEADTNREKETDFEICQSIGIRVWEFNEMIADWVKRRQE